MIPDGTISVRLDGIDIGTIESAIDKECPSKNLFDDAEVLHGFNIEYKPFIDTILEVVDQNNKTKKEIRGLKRPNLVYWSSQFPERVFINKTNTIFDFNGKNDKVLLRCSDDDDFDLGYAFLYAYFLKNSGMTKTQASKFFNELRKVGVESQLKRTEIKVDKCPTLVEQIINEAIDSEKYVAKHAKKETKE